jgi:hypothetical protein
LRSIAFGSTRRNETTLGGAEIVNLYLRARKRPGTDDAIDSSMIGCVDIQRAKEVTGFANHRSQNFSTQL